MIDTILQYPLSCMLSLDDIARCFRSSFKQQHSSAPQPAWAQYDPGSASFPATTPQPHSHARWQSTSSASAGDRSQRQASSLRPAPHSNTRAERELRPLAGGCLMVAKTKGTAKHGGNGPGLSVNQTVKGSKGTVGGAPAAAAAAVDAKTLLEKKRPGRPRKYKTVEERRSIRLEKNREAAKRLYAKKVDGFKILETEVVENRASIATGQAKLRQYELLFSKAGMDPSSLSAMLQQEMQHIAASRAAARVAVPNPAGATAAPAPPSSNATGRKSHPLLREFPRTPDHHATTSQQDTRLSAEKLASSCQSGMAESDDSYSSDDDAALILLQLETQAQGQGGEAAQQAQQAADSRSTCVKHDSGMDSSRVTGMEVVDADGLENSEIQRSARSLRSKILSHHSVSGTASGGDSAAAAVKSAEPTTFTDTNCAAGVIREADMRRGEVARGGERRRGEEERREEEAGGERRREEARGCGSGPAPTWMQPPPPVPAL